MKNFGRASISRLALILALPLTLISCTSALKKDVIADDSPLYTLMQAKDFARLIEARDDFASRGLNSAESKWLLENSDNPTYIGLTNYGNLYIPARGASGDMAFVSDGALCAHDLFTVGGRAQWIMRVFETKNSPAQWRISTGAGTHFDSW